MKRLLAALVFVAAATPALGCTSDDDSTDRIDIEGVDCIVVRNGFGRIQRTDCNWSSAEPKDDDQ